LQAVDLMLAATRLLSLAATARLQGVAACTLPDDSIHACCRVNSPATHPVLRRHVPEALPEGLAQVSIWGLLLSAVRAAHDLQVEHTWLPEKAFKM
jgi:hypothetical protein